MVKKSTTRKTKKKASSGAPKKVTRAAAAGGARPKKTSASSRRASPPGSAKKKATSKKKTSKSKSVTKKTPAVSKASTTKKKTARATGSTKKTARAATKPSAKTSTKKKVTGKKKTTARRSGGRLRSGTVAEAASAASADSKGYVYINGRRVRMISRKSVPPPAKKTPRTTAKDDLVLEKPVEPAKVRKTKLSPEDLDHYRTLLLIKRAELVGDLSAMQAEALQASGNLSNVPIHMADIGTDTYDQDFMLGLAETERKQLREIDDALQRIEDKTYGVCQMTGRTIPKSRLNAKPWAKYTIGAAREIEESGGR